jgi:hypothetical protein
MKARNRWALILAFLFCIPLTLQATAVQPAQQSLMRSVSIQYLRPCCC